MTTNILEATKITKMFGGLVAVNNVDFIIPRGSICSLIGPNGAGKTTFFNMITGLYVPTSGTILFDGRSIAGLKPNAVTQRGVGRTFQNIRLFANMTALENVMVGRHTRSRAGVLGAVLRCARTRAEEAAIRDKARALLDYVGLKNKGRALAGHLSYGDQRRLEIARALATEPTLLALDEPVAGMNPTERRQMDELFRKLRDGQVTLLLIEHDVKLVMGLCDRVAVLDYGRKIAEGAADAVKNDPAVISAYLGGEAP